MFSRIGFKTLVWLLVCFLIAFPKGGFKVGTVPITWGYILLGITCFIAIVNSLSKRDNFLITKNKFICMAAVIPLQLYLILSLYATGVENVGFAISLIFSFVFLPLLFFGAFYRYLNNMDLNYLFKLIKRAVFFTAIYGVFLFIFKFITGHFLEIPFLTLNQGDVGELENKYIDRGGVFKLISTYNNGNIYGVSILILLPLYVFLEKNITKRFIIYIALFLTLSRTVWIGMILYQLFTISFKKLKIKSILMIISGTLIFIFTLIYTLSFLSLDLTFLFDKNLGGRADQLSAINNITFLSSNKFNDIPEIVYIGFLKSFGVLGFILFLIAITTPVFLYLFRIVKRDAIGYKKSLFHGLLIYLILACSDGAILYIPVMVFYWFISVLLISINQTEPYGNHLNIS